MSEVNGVSGGQTGVAFEVGPNIGHGGVGIVYAGRQMAPSRQVAIKVLREEFVVDETARRHFLQEAEICARLNDLSAHPGIVRVIAVEENLFPPVEMADGRRITRPAMVMELLIGQTLKQRIEKAKGGMPLDDCVRILKGILEPLEVVHARTPNPVVHRDIKPANIFLCRLPNGKERVVVTDFGIARVVNAAAATNAGFRTGTAAYMSPEQVDSGLVDIRTDLYACGIILYEMLTGQPPFRGENEYAVAFAHMEKPPPPLAETVPAHLRATVMKALSKKPEHRFQSSTEFLEALDPAEAPPPPEPLQGPPLQPPPVRLPWPWIVGSGAAVFTAAVCGVLLFGPVKAEQVQRKIAIPAPAMHQAASGITPVVIRPGVAGTQVITEEISSRFGREISRKTVSSEIETPPQPPRTQESTVETRIIPKPEEKILRTSNLPAGERHLLQAGHEGQESIETVRIYEGEKLVDTQSRSPKLVVAPQADVFEMGKAKPVFSPIPRPTSKPKPKPRPKPTRPPII